MALSQSILPEFDHEVGNSRKMLERCPQDKFGWKPHEKSLSLGELVSHICTLPQWATMTVNEESFDMAPVGGEAHKPEQLETLPSALDAFDKNMAAARAAIAGASDERLFGNWALLSGGDEIFSMPRIAVLRGFVFNHAIHHRGQMSVYLRLLDVPLPAIYGPSADEQGM